jgi:hypothetical protein
VAIRPAPPQLRLKRGVRWTCQHVQPARTFDRIDNDASAIVHRAPARARTSQRERFHNGFVLLEHLRNGRSVTATAPLTPAITRPLIRQHG